ncbi:hypothetical protein RYH73_06200 [Olivibacter sp. CPCC 100613]|uniref:hypothetical protein n=1 Tax=Olivibacter sp. CPCC 100613 TaxID=3079931 RepID=UPI002FF61E7F
MRNDTWFYLPWAYFLKTRISSTFKLVSWGFIYVIPTFVISLSLWVDFSLAYILSYLIQFAVIYNFYEVGYIENDNETTKKEKNPTERLGPKEKLYYENKKNNIYIFRIIIGFSLLCILGYIESYSCGFIYFAGASLLILLIYLIYNRIRSFLTLPLHFLLVCLRFLSYIFLGTLYLSATNLLFLVCMYPLINIIERASNPKFRLTLLAPLYYSERKLAWFRAAYYIIVSLLLLWLQTLSVVIMPWILSLYMFFSIYRFFGLLYILRDRKSV